MMSKVIPQSYYRGEDVVALARDMLGKLLVTNFEGKLTAGFITETEAYRGWGDKACHARLNRRTKRTEIMYHAGGVAYVYLCYGIHHLFNIITNKAQNADAVLLRAIEPQQGIETMLERRKLSAVKPKLSAGPGNLSKAMGISTADYGLELSPHDNIWLEKGKTLNSHEITTSTRIGINYAGEDALLPWRFYDNSSDYISIR